MTRFSDKIISIFVNKIATINSESKADDTGYINSTLTYFHMGRDTYVSQIKRDVLSELSKAIYDLSTGKHVDEIFYKKCQKLIEAKIEAISEISVSRRYSLGHTVPKLHYLSDLLKQIYMKLHKMELLDISKDQLPLNLFKTHAAEYIINKTMESLERGLITKAIQYPYLTNLSTLISAQEELISSTIKACEEDLKLQSDLRLQCRCVVSYINDLKENATALSLEYLPQPNQTVSIPFIAVELNIKHDGGPLQSRMNEAILAIKALQSPTQYQATQKFLTEVEPDVVVKEIVDDYDIMDSTFN